MTYSLNETQNAQKLSTWAAIRGLWQFLAGERRVLVLAAFATLVNSFITLLAPLLVAHVIDTYIVTGEWSGVVTFAGILFALYLVGLGTQYTQIRLMGGLGQRIIFKLRTAIFAKLQELPVAFFNANKAGDLISRINNDTDKLNQFFSQTLVQFVGSLAVMIGAGIFILAINFELGAAALAPALALFLVTRLLSPWVKARNASSLTSTGDLSAEVSESLSNFKVVVAFNRRDFFRKRFASENEVNYKAAIGAGIANNTFTPIFGLSSNAAQLIVLAFGIYLISAHSFTVGMLIGFIAYVNNFYNPLRQLAALWANFQVALAGWDRIAAILQMENDMPVIAIDPVIARSEAQRNDEAIQGSCTDSGLPRRCAPRNDGQLNAPILEFRDVTFQYDEDTVVLRDISFALERGKTYALVGPTGGGKTTTASLMARLYDPTHGTVTLCGRDIRTYSSEERTKKIGFILQEPILFSGTVRENILYGSDLDVSGDTCDASLRECGLDTLLARFDGGLDAKVATSGDSLSLGQKQLIAFMRAVLRRPDILILDEATANIDTVTEQLLEDILKRLPPETTKVIIAHRLNTIENADDIFFVSGGSITEAGSMEHAVEMLLQGNKGS